jgi:6-phosphogluconolactonase
MSATLKIFADDDDLAEHAAGFIIRTLADAVGARGRAMLALSGGTTPLKTYALLSQPAMRDRIDWARTYIFFGDERFVPGHDPISNFATAQRLLLEPVSAPPENTFPVPTQLASADAAARAYAGIINMAFGVREEGEPPRFDLIVLGLGADGHTAALFPGAESMWVDDRWAVASPSGKLFPHVDRITMTFPVLNAARAVLFLVSGATKAPVLHDVLEGGLRREECPAAGVTPENGALYWFVDRAAASRLSPESQ